MNLKLGIAMVVAVAVAISVAIFLSEPIDVSGPQEKDKFDGWNRSGPFALNKFEYNMGDNIFFIAEGLKAGDAGSMVFVMPNGTSVYISIPFDGSVKSGFNQYFKPALSKARSICSADDLIGEWHVGFTNTNYQQLRFEIVNQTEPSEVGNYEKIC